MRSDTRHVLFRGGSPPSLPQPLPLYSTYGVLRLDRCTLDEARVAEGLEGVVAEELPPDLILHIFDGEGFGRFAVRMRGEGCCGGRGVEVRAQRGAAGREGQRRVVEDGTEPGGLALDVALAEEAGCLPMDLVGDALSGHRGRSRMASHAGATTRIGGRASCDGN